MSKAKTTLRPGMTAIAAVLALSSTPLLAQAAEQPAATVTIAPPAPAVAQTAPSDPAPASATPMTIAPAAPAETSANASAPADGAAPPVPVMKTQSSPVVHQPDADAAEAPTRRAEPARSVAAARTSTAPSRQAAVTPSIEARPAEPAPVAARSPAPQPRPAPQPEAVAAPAVASHPAAPRDGFDEETIAIAGGIGLLAIAGGAFAVFRRRREDHAWNDEDAFELGHEPEATVTPVPVPASLSAPAFRSPFAEPARAASLPEGFDDSRFGPHVRAAYAGPTAENPSRSLKRRLARARFFDQRERMGQRFETAAAGARKAAGYVTTRLGRREGGGQPAFQG